MDYNANRKPDKRIVSWGKYAGKKFSEVPTDYLEWFIKNSYHQMINRRKWAEEELLRRSVM